MEIRKIVEVDKLEMNYGELKAVDQLSFKVKEGEIFGLLGPNGAGKTTTLECILGTRKAKGGHIALLDRSPKGYKGELYEQVGVQFQTSSYPDRIRVGELCRMTAALYKETES